MFQPGIRSKAFIAIFLACTIAVIAGISLFDFRVKKSFNKHLDRLEARYLNSLISELEDHYRDEHSWERFRSRREWQRLIRFMGQQIRNQLPPPHRGPMERQTAHPRRAVLLDASKNFVQGRRNSYLPQSLKPIQVNAQVVGYLGFYPRRNLHEDSDNQQFVNDLRRTFILVGLLTLFSSLIIALLFSRQLVKPIRSLRRSTSALAAGDYKTRIDIHSNDELGDLSRDFNQLAESLQQHETSRRQWIMDIAHELRTPLAILRGEIEAIQDGVSDSSPQTLQSLHQETLHLQRLVDDLYTLSMSDNGSLTYQKTELDFNELIRDSLAQFENQFTKQNIAIQVELPDKPVSFHGDSQRLQQLIQNLLKNSLRYTDTPGKLLIQLQQENQRIRLTIDDSAPGVPNESLPRLFERLYRVENSRNRATGGAGIGLSICYNIVQAHAGKISASHSTLGGLNITMTFPDN